MPGCCRRNLWKKVILDQLRSKILTDENLEKLVVLVNEELQSGASCLQEKLDAIDSEMADTKSRLSRIYDALETGKIDLDDVAPRIRELRTRSEEVGRTRIQIDAEMVVQGVDPVDVALGTDYAKDLRSLLEEASFTERKAFLRSFIDRIEVSGDEATVHYRLPLPTGERLQRKGVGSTYGTLWWSWGVNR